MQVRINRLTPGEGHYFYGYYDNYAMTQDGSRHLLNKVSFMDRLQKAGDVCNLGYLDRKEGNDPKLGGITSEEEWTRIKNVLNRE